MDCFVAFGVLAGISNPSRSNFSRPDCCPAHHPTPQVPQEAQDSGATRAPATTERPAESTADGPDSSNASESQLRRRVADDLGSEPAPRRNTPRAPQLH